MTNEEIIKHLHEALNSVDITFPYRYVFVEAIEALSQSSIPSDIDEAAEEYCSDNTPLGATCRACFRDGAEWMAGQGVTFESLIDYYDGYYLDCSEQEHNAIEQLGLKAMDKAIVQIRKK